MHQWVKGLGLTFAISAVLGCGGGSGTPSTLPPSTPLATLTPSQQTQLCIDLGKYEANNLSKANACKLSGFFAAITELSFNSSATDASLQSACSDAVTQCNSAPAQGSTGGQCDFSGIASCATSATIADVNACTTDEVAALNGAFATLPPCQALSNAYLTANPDPTGGATQPASCVSLQAKCPNVPVGG